MPNVSYPHVIHLHRDFTPVVRLMRSTIRFEGAVVVEDTGVNEIRIECEYLNDRALLAMLNGDPDQWLLILEGTQA